MIIAMAELLSFCQLGVLLKCAQRSWYYLPSASLHVRFLRKCYHCQSVLCNLYWTQWPCWLSTLHGNSSLQPGCCSWTLGSSKKRCRVFFIIYFFFHKQFTETQQHTHPRGYNSAPTEYFRNIVIFFPVVDYELEQLSLYFYILLKIIR